MEIMRITLLMAQYRGLMCLPLAAHQARKKRSYIKIQILATPAPASISVE